MCINIYDVRLDDENPACGMNWPPEIHDVTEYLGVRSYLVPLNFFLLGLLTILRNVATKRCSSSSRNRTSRKLGRMSRGRPPRIPRREDEFFVYHSPTSARKNPGIDFRGGPRLDMQLCWVGGYDQGFDMEWWNGPWGMFFLSLAL